MNPFLRLLLQFELVHSVSFRYQNNCWVQTHFKRHCLTLSPIPFPFLSDQCNVGGWAESAYLPLAAQRRSEGIHNHENARLFLQEIPLPPDRLQRLLRLPDGHIGSIWSQRGKHHSHEVLTCRWIHITLKWQISGPDPCRIFIIDPVHWRHGAAMLGGGGGGVKAIPLYALVICDHVRLAHFCFCA